MNIFVSAGDHSGDIHASNLISAILKLKQNVSVRGFGGECLRATVDDFCADLVSLGGFGFWQPIKQFLKLKGLFNKHVVNGWSTKRPDIVILVDYYGFNIHVARHAKQLGIPIYYFISPQVWASRPGRVASLKAVVTKMLLILPFEEPIYRKAGLSAVFVGNPMVDTVPKPSEQQTSATPYIGLFPGSRSSVLKKHLPILLETAKILEKQSHAKFAFFASKNTAHELTALPYPVIIDDEYSERKKLTIAITTSGTVSLENALLGIPMIVMYKLSAFNYMLAKMIVSISYIAMANILLKKQVVPELIQNMATPENLAKEALKFINDRSYYNAVRDELLTIRATLGSPGVYERSARIILENQ